MGKLDIHRQNALKSLHMANYMMATTYPLLKEPKTLLIIAGHALSSFMSSVSQLLVYERAKRKIPPYHDNDESKLNSFKNYLVSKHSFQEYLAVIERIMSINKERKESSAEFSRDEKLTAGPNQPQKIGTVSEEDARKFIKKAKEFTVKIDELTVNE